MDILWSEYKNYRNVDRQIDYFTHAVSDTQKSINKKAAEWKTWYRES